MEIALAAPSRKTTHHMTATPHPSAPGTAFIEDSIRRVLSDRVSIDGGSGPAPCATDLKRIRIYGRDAIMARDSHVLLWRRGVPKGLLKDATDFQDWNEDRWAYFVAAVRQGSGAPFFHVVSVHGELELAIEELVSHVTVTPPRKHETQTMAA